MLPSHSAGGDTVPPTRSQGGVSPSTWIVGTLSLVFIVFLPFLHIGIFHVYLWVPDKRPVDQDRCRCDCWDTIFKGSYESQMIVKYKHLYFNSTLQTYAIFVLTAAIFVVAYESFKRLFTLFIQRKLRCSMLTLIILDIYPHYYSWWMYFNYINDGFYSQFVHQTFFSVTEAISTVLIFAMCSTESRVNSRKVLVIVSISVVHLVVGGLDQFFVQLVLGHGQLFQKFRDLGFLLSDVVHIVLPLRLLKETYKTKRLKDIFQEKDLKNSFICIFTLTVIGKLLL